MPTDMFDLGKGVVFNPIFNRISRPLVNFVVADNNELWSLPDWKRLVDIRSVGDNAKGVVQALIKYKTRKEVDYASEGDVVKIEKYIDYYLVVFTRGVFVIKVDRGKQVLELWDDGSNLQKVISEGDIEPNFNQKYNSFVISYVVNPSGKVLFNDTEGRLFRYEGGTIDIGNRKIAQVTVDSANANLMTNGDGLLSHCSQVVMLNGFAIIYNSETNSIVYLDTDFINLVISGNEVVVEFLPFEVQGMYVMGASLFIFSDDAFFRYTLEISNNGEPILKKDNNFNFYFQVRRGASVLAYRDMLIFLTENMKLYALNGKGIVTELSDKQVPFIKDFNSYREEIDGESINYYGLKKVFLLLIAGMPHIVVDNTLLNLSTGEYSFYNMAQDNLVGWQSEEVDPNNPDLVQVNKLIYLDGGAKITAVSNDSQLLSIENRVYFSRHLYKSDYKPRDKSEVELDAFIWGSEEIIFEKPSKLEGLEVIFSDFYMDLSQVKKMFLGIRIIQDGNFLDMDTLLDERKYVMSEFTNKFGTNTFVSRLNISCKSFVILLRFDQIFDLTGAFDVKKIAIKGIRYNYSA